jgi:glyoxylase-like metal-dependent hydrolase (beta-lactamase superfamily II)
MVTVERHGDVTRFRFSSPRSRLVGYSVSAYLVRGALVDTGFPAVAGDVARLVDELRPRGAVVTHKHEDHAGNAELLARRGVPLALGDATRATVQHVAPIGFYRRFTWGSMPALASQVTPFDPAAAGLALVPAPGHSVDHHVVWDAETRTVFGGDLFLGVKVRVAHPGENPRLLVETLRQIADLRPLRLFDAHRGPVENAVGALRAKAAWLEETIGRIDRRVAEGWSDRAIRGDVLGREAMTGYFSRGDYSRLNLVRAVRKGAPTMIRGEPNGHTRALGELPGGGAHPGDRAV